MNRVQAPPETCGQVGFTIPGKLGTSAQDPVWRGVRGSLRRSPVGTTGRQTGNNTRHRQSGHPPAAICSQLEDACSRSTSQLGAAQTQAWRWFCGMLPVFPVVRTGRFTGFSLT